MKKLAAFLLSFILFLQPLTTYAIDKLPFSDIEGHWAEETIKRHYEMGMLKGCPDGTFRPDQKMQRSELIALINRYFGLNERGKENFQDIKGNEWYATEMAKAKYYGYLKDLQANPNQLVQRKDVINMISLIIDITEQRKADEAKKFDDLNGLDEITKENIMRFSEAGYINGSGDSTFRPDAVINRAEIMTIAENVLGYIVTCQEDLDNLPEDAKKVTIISPGIKIENKKIKGDLYISPGVNGQLEIKNSVIEGQVEISGGKEEHPIRLENVDINKVVITKVKDTPKIEIKGKSHVKEVKTKSQAAVEISGETKVEQIKIQSKTSIKIGSGSEVSQLVIEQQAEVNSEQGSTIAKVEVKAEANITGQGTIKEALIEAENVEIEEKPEYIKVEDTNIKVKVGEGEIDTNNDDYIEETSQSSDDSDRDSKDKRDDEPRDRTAPIFSMEPVVQTGNGEGEIAITANSNESGKIYYVIVTQGAPITNFYQIKNGIDANGNPVVKKGIMQSGQTVTVSGLIHGEMYDTYLVIQDTAGNISIIKAVKGVNTFFDNEPPTFIEGYPAAFFDTPQSIKLQAAMNESGTVYYAVYSKPEVFTAGEFVVNAREQGFIIDIAQPATVAEAVYNSGVVVGLDYYIYFVTEDDRNNISDEIVRVSPSKSDIIPPVFLPDANAQTGATGGSINITMQLNEPGKIYYIIVPADSEKPSMEQIKAGQNYQQGDQTVSVIASGAGTAFDNFAIDGLEEGQLYDVYIVGEDRFKNSTDIISYEDIQAKDATAPSFSGEVIVEKGDQPGDVKLTATTNETTTIYYVVLESGAPAPNADQIQAGTDGNGTVAKVSGSGSRFDQFVINGLDEDVSYDIYVVAVDESENLSQVITKTGIQAKKSVDAAADTVEVDEDNSCLINVLQNDINAVSVVSFTQGANGTVTQESNSLRYTPNANYNGADSFTYTVSDGNGGTATGTVNVTVNAVNDVPVANDDSATLNEDVTVLVAVLINDTDIDGDILSITGFTQGSNGTVAQEGDSLRYTPSVNYNGADSFTYTVSDGNGGAATGTVNVTVNAVNDAPAAVNDNISVNEDGTVLVDVLVNDSDIDGDTLTITDYTQGAHGVVAQEGDSLRYTPNANYNGADSFTYTVSDGNGGTATGTVNVTVNAVNDVPVANDDSATLNEDGTVLVDVLANDTDIDGDILSITGFTQGSNGTVAQEGDSLRYTPSANYSGADSFMYEINDGNGGVRTATVNVTVNAVNDAPVAVDDNVDVNEDGTVLVDVLVNDSDIDGDTLTITDYTQGANGTVTQESNSLRYTPEANYNGADSFTYTISDGNGGTATATVNVTVNAVNDAPVAVNDSATLNEDGTVLVDVLANDTDIDGDILSITGFTQGSNGTVAQEGDSLRYTPSANYNGADSFTYTVSDGNGGAATGTVNVTVNAVNDAPAAVNDNISVNEDGTVLVDVLVNDSDIDGDTLTITDYTQGAHGAVAQEGDSLRYTPDANYNGADSFMYEINDGNGGVRTATVNVTVNAVNDVPVAVNDSATLNEDGTVLVDVLANDTDIDGDILSITGFTQGSNGTVAQEGDSLRYTPSANYNGADSLMYEINDGNGGVRTAIVNVTVNAVNDAPVVIDDSTEVDQNNTILVNVLVNDTDIEGDILSITECTQGAHGMVSIESNSLRYTPNVDYNGADSFTYTVSDGNGGTATATVNITVNKGAILSMDIDVDVTANPDGCTDFIEFSITEEGSYFIKTSSYIQPCDTCVYLYDAGKDEISNNDDYTDLYGAIIINLTPGTYYVKIGEYDMTHVYCHLEVTKQ